MGLLMQWLADKNLAPSINVTKQIFRLFFFAAIPAYFLSALWLPIPTWLYLLIAVAAIAQLIAFVLLVLHIKKNSTKILYSLSKPVKWLWILSCTALSIKLLLQAGSTIPSLNMVAYGFRPIVIGYLHLVLLGVLSIFSCGYFISESNIRFSTVFRSGLILFIAGIIITEVLLMLQGVDAMRYENIPLINYLLLAAALIMFCGLIFINRAIWKSKL
jgi:hypothetical protein